MAQNKVPKYEALWFKSFNIKLLNIHFIDIINLFMKQNEVIYSIIWFFIIIQHSTSKHSTNFIKGLKTKTISSKNY
jgi:hypothetical protein